MILSLKEVPGSLKAWEGFSKNCVPMPCKNKIAQKHYLVHSVVKKKKKYLLFIYI